MFTDEQLEQAQLIAMVCSMGAPRFFVGSPRSWLA